MACSCKCCCGCCCDGETGEQKLESQCTAPKEFQGKGTICDVCCDLGEIREDIDSEEDCPGTWVVNGRCQDDPCCTETECRQYTYESPLDDEAGDFSAFAIGTCGKSSTAIEFIESEEIYRYTTLVTITCECRASFEAATGPLRGPDAETPGDPIPYEVVSCPP